MTNLFVPYFQTSRYRVQTMVELAKPQQGECGIDLGSGDGRIVIAFAEKGVTMHGYELDKELLELSEKNIKETNITNAFIHHKNFWDADLSGFDIVTIYPMPDIMDALEKKLEKELKSGARVLTNFYTLPTWKHTTSRDKIYLYLR
ncbi:MAG: hypothetical protein RLZZ455_100 [Candidatus Parcubacteria bacterium]